ncbi:MAG: hypothetical protein BMS9Abin29_0413 [Gemmatimonadota bacterium]|nr:MAG: hypothetical protein BMS9Abin29_0413 [Gemmatimonadota bacterium]
MSAPDRPVAVDQSARSLRNIVLYYALFAAVMALLASKVPIVREVLILSDASHGISGEIERTFGGEPLDLTPGSVTGWLGILVATLSMVGALVIMLPVAWTYIVVKRRTGYHQSVVHTLLILPVAVTGTVVIVQTSLALAFSLAGIVAAVRFRTTLDDTKDAVYVFVAIGVGLASGVQALGVAAALAIIFCITNVILWKLNFGNIYADQQDRTRALDLGDVLAGPRSAESAVAIGDTQLLSAMTEQDLTEVADRVSRMERYLEAETEVTRDRKLFSVLMVHTDGAGPGQEAAEPVLERLAVRWRLAEILPGAEGVSILEYLVRLRDGVSPGALLDSIRKAGGDKVRAAELRSLKGLKKRT